MQKIKFKQFGDDKNNNFLFTRALIMEIKNKKHASSETKNTVHMNKAPRIRLRFYAKLYRVSISTICLLRQRQWNSRIQPKQLFDFMNLQALRWPNLVCMRLSPSKRQRCVARSSSSSNNKKSRINARFD